jgi:hypothetical protein
MCPLHNHLLDLGLLYTTGLHLDITDAYREADAPVSSIRDSWLLAAIHCYGPDSWGVITEFVPIKPS